MTDPTAVPLAPDVCAECGADASQHTPQSHNFVYTGKPSPGVQTVVVPVTNAPQGTVVVTKVTR